MKMKIKIKPFILRLIKDNVVYIISIAVILGLLGVTIKMSIGKIIQSNKKVKQLTADNLELNKKVKLYETTIPSTEKLDDDIKLLNNLIPNIEDYFSIIYSLDKLSQETGFLIVDYTVNTRTSNANKMSITVNGLGDSSTFLKFLDEYRYAGGRLITSDKIELDPQQTGVIKLNLSFYNKKINSNNKDVTVTDEKMFEDLESIKEKVKFDLNYDDEAEANETYPIKRSLF